MGSTGSGISKSEQESTTQRRRYRAEWLKDEQESGSRTGETWGPRERKL